MADKITIKERQNTLKKYLISENLGSVSFSLNVLPLYNESWFKEKFGKVSESRIREDLKAIGYVYSNKEKAFIDSSVYFKLEIETEIIRCLYFMNLYKPISVNLIPFDYSENSNNKLSYIFLQYKKPKERIYSKYNIKNLLKNIRIYYNYVYNDPDLGDLDTIIREKYVKFEFLDSELMNILYENLVMWKSKSKKQNPFIRRKVGRVK